VIVEFYAGIGPFVLVRLVADGEIEAPHAELDRVGKQLAQMQRAGPIVRQRGVVFVDDFKHPAANSTCAVHVAQRQLHPVLRPLSVLCRAPGQRQYRPDS
jgi:hypothetical protein